MAQNHTHKQKPFLDLGLSLLEKKKQIENNPAKTIAKKQKTKKTHP